MFQTCNLEKEPREDSISNLYVAAEYSGKNAYVRGTDPRKK